MYLQIYLNYLIMFLYYSLLFLNLQQLVTFTYTLHYVNYQYTFTIKDQNNYQKMEHNSSLVNQQPTLGSGPKNYEWYQALKKPKITPPQWVFPVVWTILYIMIIASFFVYLKDTDFQFTVALIIFSIQIFLNIIWTPIFFWKKMITLALMDIIVLWVFILVTIIMFHARSPVAAYLLIPYNIWVTLATYLNAYIVCNNPDPSARASNQIIQI